MTKGFRVAVAQMTSGATLDTNLEQALTLVSHAANRGAEYIQLPEWASFFGPERLYKESAQTLNGPFVSTLRALAIERRIVIHIGSFLEVGTGGRYYNTSVVLYPDGHHVLYRKMHLFDVDIPDGVTWRESNTIMAGEEMVIASTGEAQLGLSICFDVRFPELYRALSVAGANVLCVPAAFSSVTGPAHWESLLRARAIENGAFVLAAAQSGGSAPTMMTHGHAMIIDPWGEVLAETTARGAEVLMATIDLVEVDEVRQEIDTLHLRRPTLYNGVVRRA